MLQDPDFMEKMDWSGVSPSLPGTYTSVTSGTWFRDVKAFYEDNYDEDIFVCPVIMGSDSTHLTFSGSQKAHNVYVTPGCMHVEHRQKMDGMFSVFNMPSDKHDMFCQDRDLLARFPS